MHCRIHPTVSEMKSRPTSLHQLRWPDGRMRLGKDDGLFGEQVSGDGCEQDEVGGIDGGLFIVLSCKQPFLQERHTNGLNAQESFESSGGHCVEAVGEEESRDDEGHNGNDADELTDDMEGNGPDSDLQEPEMMPDEPTKRRERSSAKHEVVSEHARIVKESKTGRSE